MFLLQSKPLLEERFCFLAPSYPPIVPQLAPSQCRGEISYYERIHLEVILLSYFLLSYRLGL